MIVKPTVFVIGAGAGVPYRFPTGTQLTDQITADHVGAPEDALIRRRGWSIDIHQGETDDFAEAVQLAQPKSIDDFLREQPGFAYIGKLLIAGHLSQFERSDALFKTDTKQHWLRHLWHAMKAPPRDFPLRNRASFIVFNYDRCVEHFLTNVMVGTYPDVTLQEAWEAIRGVIVHPHGVLGDYIPTSIDGDEKWGDGARSFMPAKTPEEAKIAAGGIRFFWEEGRDSIRERIDKMLEDAQYVVFLGFGYIESNLDLFQVLFDRVGYDSTSVPTILGSCYKMRTQGRRRVEQRFNSTGITLDGSEPVDFLEDNVPLHELQEN